MQYIILLNYGGNKKEVIKQILVHQVILCKFKFPNATL